jgi:hypothetical protein
LSNRRGGKQEAAEGQAKIQAAGARLGDSLRAADQAERAERQRQFDQQMQYYQT